MRNARLSAGLSVVLLFVLASPIGAEETFTQKLVGAATSSAGSKGAEFAVKFVAGWIYGVSCKPEQQNDEGSKALCGALGGLSGKAEEEWKAKIESQLQQINSRLDEISSTQQRIVYLLQQQHREMNDQFKQLGNNVKITDILTTIDAFWGKFEEDVRNPKSNMTKDDLERFANDVVRSDLHTKLGQLNSLLANPKDGSQPALKFPFYQFRQTWSQQGPPEAFPGMRAYDFAEEKFAAYHGEQQKAYLVFLWALKIIQAGCDKRKETPCAALPISPEQFMRDYERYTREQVEAFDAGVDGMILAYSRPDSDDPNFLLKSPVVEPILMRMNMITSIYLGEAKGEARGAWGEVVAADGDPWNGHLKMQCGGVTTVSPEFSYVVPADTRYGPSIDWWTSRGNNKIYDEVRFTRSWRVYHYKVLAASPGPCKIEPDTLPWASPNGEVTSVRKEGKDFAWGFFYGVQRAGGTFAMASGQRWDASNVTSSVKGDAARKDEAYRWLGSRFHHESLWAGILDYARVEHRVGETLLPTQKLQVKREVYAINHKSIYFPDGGTVTVRMSNHSLCDTLCRPGLDRESAVMDYDVENSPYEAGKLTAVVSIFLDPTVGYNDRILDRARNGIFVDGSYTDTTLRMTKNVNEDVSGTARVNPGTAYHTQYYIYFDLNTATKRLDATSYRIVEKVTPRYLFLTQGGR